MAKQNPVVPILKNFSKKWDKISIPVVNLISKKINEGMNITSAVDFAFKKYKIENEFRSLTLNTILQSAKAGGVTIKNELGIKKFFLDKHWEGDKLTLSQRISKLQFRDIVRNEISRNFKAGKTVLQIAKSLTDKDLTKADIPAYISNLTSAARRVAEGDIRALREFKIAITNAGNQIKKLATRKGAQQRLKKAYQNIVDGAETFTEKQLDKAIDRAVRAKARYNAERITRTEGARAYGAGKMTEAKDDPDVIGLQWVLSSGHSVFDICDYHAGVDAYNMGKGIYPKDEFPEYPAHPHCLCVIDEVYGEEPIEGKFDSQAGEEWINKLPDKKANMLLRDLNSNEFIEDAQEATDNLPVLSDKLIK